ncbi:MAG: NAD(+) diphosphatase [Gammaproteobacteria bacterium]|nr:NAD(+) diphosphatase [Gammaproteobacteria bacterium]
MNTTDTDHLARSRRNRFTAVRLNREVELRDNSQWVSQTLKDPNTRFVPLWRSRSLLERTLDGTLATYLSPTGLSEPDRIQPPTLLGNDGKREYFAVSITDSQKDDILTKFPGARFADLRRASLDMAAKHAGILAYAKALHYWQHRHAFCGVCGEPNLLRSAGHRMMCSNEECARESYPRIDPAIIVLVTNKDSCLLGRNAKWPAKQFSTLAGFVEPGESLEDAVVREVYEEVQVQLQEIRYVSSQPWPFPASAMCGFYAESLDQSSGSSEEVEETRWFTVDSLTTAVLNDEVRLSPPVSIAFRLLADWFQKNGGGNLEDIVRRARAMNVSLSSC